MSPFMLFPLGEILSLMEYLWAIFNYKEKKEKKLKKIAVNLFIRRVSEKRGAKDDDADSNRSF